MHIAIRADGGDEIGYGHLVRTNAIADRFLEEGHRITVATRTPGPARDVYSNAIDIRELHSTEHEVDFEDWVAASDPSWVLADSYDVDTDHQRAIAKLGPRLALILDDTRFRVRADVVVNGNVYAPSLKYDWIGPEPTWCLGTNFLPIRRAIREQIPENLPTRESPERALVTMGGSDTRRTTPIAIRAFDDLGVRVDVIVGPGFDDRGAIDRAAEETSGVFDVVEDPADLPERMAEVDLAVSATGSTVYELLALGTPTVGLPQADNQEPVAAALTQQGAIVSVDTPGLQHLRTAIDSLLRSPEKRQEMRERGTSLVDGEGVDRIYETIVGGCPDPDTS